MKLHLAFVSVLFFSLLGHAFAGEGHVGEIRYSILTPEQFQHSNFEQSATRDPRGCSNNTVTSYPHHHQAWPTTRSGKIIKPEGVNETRPRSIIVNTFIKLRESALDSQKRQVEPQLNSSITRSPEFKTAVETILQNMMRRSY